MPKEIDRTITALKIFDNSSFGGDHYFFISIYYNNSPYCDGWLCKKGKILSRDEIRSSGDQFQFESYRNAVRTAKRYFKNLAIDKKNSNSGPIRSLTTFTIQQ